MHSRESSTAPAQKPTQPIYTGTGQAAPTQSPQNSTVEQAIEQLSLIAALGHSVKQNYINQLMLVEKIASAEWQLSGRSLIIAAALVVCFGAGIILFWGSILLVLGYLLFQLSHSVLITASTLVILQFILLFWCWRSLSYVLSQVGFSNTWQQLRLLFFTTPQEQETQHAHSTLTEKTAGNTR